MILITLYTCIHTTLQVAYDDNLLRGCANDDYTRFFGEYSQERYYIVQTNYMRIQERFLDNGYNIVCHDDYCDDYTFAFVYPDDPDYNIYVCGAYWSASVDLQPDSKVSQTFKHLNI